MHSYLLYVCYNLGISYVTTNDAKISSFDADNLMGTNTYITDFTSIGKSKKFWIKYCSGDVF